MPALRPTALVAVTALALGGLAGCGGDEPTSSPTTGPRPSTTTAPRSTTTVEVPLPEVAVPYRPVLAHLLLTDDDVPGYEEPLSNSDELFVDVAEAVCDGAEPVAEVTESIERRHLPPSAVEQLQVFPLVASAAQRLATEAPVLAGLRAALEGCDAADPEASMEIEDLPTEADEALVLTMTGGGTDGAAMTVWIARTGDIVVSVAHLAPAGSAPVDGPALLALMVTRAEG